MILFFANLTTPSGPPARGIHVRFIAVFGAAIRCKIERLDTGLTYDFDPAVLGFSTSPQQPFGATVERGMGLFAMDLPTPSTDTFPAGDYCVSLHDSRINDQVIGLQYATLT